MTCKFDNYLKELLSEHIGSIHAWLTPENKLIPVPHSHGDWAGEYLINQGVDKRVLRDYDRIIKIMFEKGWMRISTYADTIYCHNSLMRPSNSQTKELKNVAIERQFGRVVYENDSDEFVLWTNSDVL